MDGRADVFVFIKLISEAACCGKKKYAGLRNVKRSAPVHPNSFYRLRLMNPPMNDRWVKLAQSGPGWVTFDLTGCPGQSHQDNYAVPSLLYSFSSSPSQRSNQPTMEFCILRRFGAQPQLTQWSASRLLCKVMKSLAAAKVNSFAAVATNRCLVRPPSPTLKQSEKALRRV